MAKYRDFIEKFQEKLPDFLKNYSQEIAKNIVIQIQEGVNKDGVELRGYFSIKKTQKKERKSIIFRNFKDLKSPRSE